MTQMTAALVVTADVDSLVAGTRRLKTEYQSVIDDSVGLKRATKSAEDSFDAFERQMGQTWAAVDQLKNRYDPLYAATQRLETGEEALTQAYRQGQITIGERDRLMGALRAEYDLTTGAVSKTSTSILGLSTATKGGAGGLQNMSYQLQDVFTQVGMGVPIMGALGQQAPQILSGFGQVGAVMGVVAAAAFPLAAALLNVGDSGAAAEDQVDGLRAAVDAASDAFEDAIQPMDKLIEKYGENAAKVRALNLEIAELNLTELKDQLEALSPAFDDMLGRYRTSASGGHDLRNYLLRMQGQLSLTRDEAILFNAALNEIGTPQGWTETQAALETLKQLFADIGIDVTELPPKFRSTYLELQEITKEGYDAEAVIARIEGLADDLSFDGGAEGAKRMADELTRAASRIADITAFSALDRVRDTNTASRLGLEGAEREAFLYSLGIERRLAKAGADDPEIAAESARAYRDALTVYAEAETYKDRIASGGGGGGGRKDPAAAAMAEIRREMLKLAEMDDLYARQVAEAERWRDDTLAALDPTRAGFDAFAADVETIFNARLQAAYEADLANRDDWQAGLERGLSEIAEDMASWADVTENLLVKWAEAGEDAFVSLAMTGKASVGDLVDYTLEQMLRLAYQQAVQPGIDAVAGMVVDGIGGIFGGSSGGVNATISPAGWDAMMGYAHTGSVPGQSVTTSAPLGPDERLTVTRMGEKVFTPRQLETASALVDALAMQAARPATAQVSLGVEVHNHSSSARVETRRAEDGGVRIDIIDQIEGAMASRVATGRGALATAMKSTFGLGRSYGGQS